MRESEEIFPVLLSERPGFFRHVFDEIDNLCWRFGHLGDQRHFGVILVAQQCCCFRSQLENPRDHIAVIDFLVGSKFRRARHVGAIEALTQGSEPGVLHHRPVAGIMQGELPAGLAVFCCGLLRNRLYVCG